MLRTTLDLFMLFLVLGLGCIIPVIATLLVGELNKDD